MPAGLHGADNERRMLVGIVGQHHAVYVMLQELIVIRVIGKLALGIEILSHFLQHLRIFVAHSHQLGAARLGGKAHHRLATAADDDDAKAHPHLLFASSLYWENETLRKCILLDGHIRQPVH